MTTSCEFVFSFGDVTAARDACMEATVNQSWAHIDDVNAQAGAACLDVATLEPDFGWPLEGDKIWLPEQPQLHPWGWWSTELSGPDGHFFSAPVLTVTFADESGTPTPHSSAGLTLTFFATLPGAVDIAWYGREGELLQSGRFVPDNFTCFCACQVENYYKVVVSVPEMSAPYRYLRVTGVFFGEQRVIGDSMVTFAKLTEEVDPVALSAPVSTLEVGYYTPNEEFALLDPAGAHALFQWRQRVAPVKTVNGVRTPLGLYYLRRAKGTESAVTTLSCTCALGVLDAMEFLGGIYEAVPVTQVLAELFTDTDIAFELDATLSSQTLTGYLPLGSRRAALAQIAFAIGAVVDATRSGAVRLYPLPNASSVSITPARKVIGHRVELDELVTEVSVTAHNWVLEGSVQELARADYDIGVHTVRFDSPASATKITGAAFEAVHPNYCTFRVSAAGRVIVSGYRYKDNASVFTACITPLPAGESPATKTVENATLVGPQGAQAAAQRLLDYFQGRYRSEGRLLPGGEVVAQKVALSSMGSKSLVGHIERMVTDLHGGCLETIKMRGRPQ